MFDLKTSGLDQNNGKVFELSMAPLTAHPKHFLSSGIKSIIVRETAVIHSFFYIKDLK